MCVFVESESRRRSVVDAGVTLSSTVVFGVDNSGTSLLGRRATEASRERSRHEKSRLDGRAHRRQRERGADSDLTFDAGGSISVLAVSVYRVYSRRSGAGSVSGPLSSI